MFGVVYVYYIGFNEHDKQRSQVCFFKKFLFDVVGA